MTRKHYNAIAKALKDYHTEIADSERSNDSIATRLATLDDVVGILSDIFKADNSNFDRDRFASACGQYE